ncbi:sporulation membrane protein YtaF [Heliobacillus mobilis]|uniref:Sporulation membrane protein YtaF n=1 Tax=Heliobacterium mobile TaxID=28064 RepID=A0A6I3SJ74_HELMO|nr:sporulation membrane protein YtaF [Heliobacterium mobile]
MGETVSAREGVIVTVWSLLGLAIALSLDGFGAGIAYGIKRIRVPLFSLLVICLCSTIAMAVALLAGHGLTTLIPGEWAGKLGGLILIMLGLFQLLNTLKDSSNHQIAQEDVTENASELEAEQILSITLRPFGLVIQVLREPTRADLDHSGELVPREALLLGIALNMDAMAAGLGASMVGSLPLFTPLVVGLTQLLFVSTGVYFGHLQARWAGGTWIAYGSGLVLLSLGIGKIFF